MTRTQLYNKSNALDEKMQEVISFYHFIITLTSKIPVLPDMS